MHTDGWNLTIQAVRPSFVAIQVEYSNNITFHSRNSTKCAKQTKPEELATLPFAFSNKNLDVFFPNRTYHSAKASEMTQ
jgi:hypothetical protein